MKTNYIERKIREGRKGCREGLQRSTRKLFWHDQYIHYLDFYDDFIHMSNLIKIYT